MYLDWQGLGAVWREGLLAQSVLQRLADGEQRVGYANHPQLDRFKATDEPLVYISAYLLCVHNEACKRGYNYNRSLIGFYDHVPPQLPVTEGQLAYEWDWLLEKLKKRDPEWCDQLEVEVLFPHPLFVAIPGDIEPWEVVKGQEA
jgi:hypothetical protein